MGRTGWLAIGALALNGCVAEQMAAMRGRPVAGIEQRFGPPARIADLTVDERLYTWTRRADLKAAPPPVSFFQPTANGQFDRVRRSYASGRYCEFRVLARRRAADGEWMVKHVYEPGLRCD